MRKKKVEGEYQIDSWPKGPEWSLCPLARPDIAMGPESQIEAWSARNSGRLKTPGSHHQFASCVRRKTTVSNAATTDHCLRDDHPAERRRGLGCQGQRHRGEGRNTLDIPLHRRNLWEMQKRTSARSLPIDPFYEGGCQGHSFPYLGVLGPDIRVPNDAQQGACPGDDDMSFLI